MTHYPSLWEHKLCSITHDFCHIFQSLLYRRGARKEEKRFLMVGVSHHRLLPASQDYIYLDHRPHSDTCEKLISNMVHSSRFRELRRYPQHKLHHG